MKKILAAVALSLAAATGFAAEEPATHLFELRTYHAAPGKMDALLKRFEDHTLDLFKNHGMTNVAYWREAEKTEDSKLISTNDRLIFLLSYPDREAREASWKAFSNDPAWIAASAASEKDGKLVSKVDQVFLEPTDFSSPFIAAADGVTRLFEMRVYTTMDGKLDALHSRFRDHTTQLFEKHGMTNLGYFNLEEGQPDAETTLLYFLAHSDLKAAESSWDSFRNDPVWIAAKSASEEAEGGSLTVPDGVKSKFLVATEFSPIR